MSQLSFNDLCSAFESVSAQTKPVLIKKPISPVPPRMIMPDVARKQFIGVFAHTAQNMRRWDVFRDFITLAASELDMARIRTPENIERSRQILAYAQCMLEAGLNPSEHLYVECIDIDPIAADMAFIQLSLLGIPAKVITGNALTTKFTRVRYTPIYYINEWEGRLALRQSVEALAKIMQQETKTAVLS